MPPANAPHSDNRESRCRQEDPQPPRAQHEGTRSPTRPAATSLKIACCRAPARIFPCDSPTLTQRVPALVRPAIAFSPGQAPPSHHRPRFSVPRPPVEPLSSHPHHPFVAPRTRARPGSGLHAPRLLEGLDHVRFWALCQLRPLMLPMPPMLSPMFLCSAVAYSS